MEITLELMARHSPECNDRQVQLHKLYTFWITAWPAYCRSCKGKGTIHTPSSHRDEPSWTDPCETCTISGICARCGKPGLTEAGEGPCIFCGWDYDDTLPLDGYEDFCQCDTFAENAHAVVEQQVNDACYQLVLAQQTLIRLRRQVALMAETFPREGWGQSIPIIDAALETDPMTLVEDDEPIEFLPHFVEAMP